MTAPAPLTPANEPADGALVKTMSRFAEDFATIPWQYIFDVNAVFEGTIQSLLTVA